MKQIFLNSGTYTYKDLKGKLDLEKYILSVLAKDTCCVKSLVVDSMSSASGIPVAFIPQAAPQALSGAGAINITTYQTLWTTTGTDAATLVNGSVVGQLKKVTMVVDGGTGTLTPANLAGGTSITFDDVADFALLSWNGTDWVVIESSGVTINA